MAALLARLPASIPTVAVGAGSAREGLVMRMCAGVSAKHIDPWLPAEGPCTPSIRVMGDVDFTRTKSTFGVKHVSSLQSPCLPTLVQSKHHEGALPGLNALSHCGLGITASAGSCLRPISGLAQPLCRNSVRPLWNAAVSNSEHAPPTCHSYNPKLIVSSREQWWSLSSSVHPNLFIYVRGIRIRL